tara:strand:- start:19 stop:1422 length:1404 start_codon:yes stop_codon:yes gene_type:complete
MSKIEVNKVGPQCGTTVTVGCGAGQTVVVDANTVTLGRCGGTVALASGASQTGFGRTGTVDWQTGDIKTSTFTAVNGQGFFVDTNGGAVTANLPAGSAGAIVSFQDYRNTFDTHAFTVSPNGSEKINTGSGNIVLNTEGEGVTLVYIDSTVGWRSIQDNVFADIGANFIQASGGTESTTGNFKIHKFTGPGTFTVTGAGGGTPSAPSNVDYLVVAGGGAGGGRYGGGGGGGGWRASSGTTSGSYCAGPAPLTSPVSALPISAQAYPIVVGGGGAGVPDCNCNGGTGSVSSFSTVSSAGGGGGAGQGANGVAGGSGGGGSWNSGSGGTGGSGNTPPVTPPQGSSGGQGHGPSSPYATAGGGGATETGQNAVPSPPTAGRGGAGASSSICGSPISYSGGGGGSGEGAHGVTAGAGSPCGSGTAGAASNTCAADGAANRGGGGGAAYYPGPSSVSGTGGSGVVIIRYKFQ